MPEKPNITTIVSEAYLLFSCNATVEWLGAKKAAEKAVIISEARKSVSIVRHNFRLPQTAIQDAHRAAVVQKLRKAEELQIKRLRRKEKQTSYIIYWGLWQTDVQVDSALATIPTAGEKIKSLKAQFKFRQNVLNQKPTVPEMKDVFSFTKLNAAGRRIALKCTQLAVNVKKLNSTCPFHKSTAASRGGSDTTTCGEAKKTAIHCSRQWWRVVPRKSHLTSWITLQLVQQFVINTLWLKAILELNSKFSNFKNILQHLQLITRIIPGIPIKWQSPINACFRLQISTFIFQPSIFIQLWSLWIKTEFLQWNLSNETRKAFESIWIYSFAWLMFYKIMFISLP